MTSHDYMHQPVFPAFETAVTEGLPAPLVRVRVTRYGRRSWAVWAGQTLVAVCVYRRGAREVERLLTLAAAAGVVIET
jgi:hypothetical protein